MNPKNIKYRAWHKEKEVMIQVSELDLRKKRIKGRAGDEVISARFDEVDIMRATVLEDSDGQLIYEGDIVKVVEEDVPTYFFKIKFYEQEYRFYFYVILSKGLRYCFNDLFGCDSMTVIGTQYDEEKLNDNNYELLHYSFMDQDGTVILID